MTCNWYLGISNRVCVNNRVYPYAIFFAVFSPLFLGCESKEARAKIAQAEADMLVAKARMEEANAETAKAEAARLEAAARVEEAKAETAKAEAAKAKLEKTKEEKVNSETVKSEAAQKERLKTIYGVMSFLKGEKFSIKLNWENSGRGLAVRSLKQEIFAYDNFSYNEKEQSLEFQKYHFGSSYGGVIATGSSYLTSYSINLPTADCVIRISDYRHFLYEEEEPLPAKQVTLVAESSIKWIDKNSEREDGIRVYESAVAMHEEDKEKLKTMPWKVVEKGEINFIVSEDTAPRLKAALEDLLKAHGVEVPKY